MKDFQGGGRWLVEDRIEMKGGNGKGGICIPLPSPFCQLKLLTFNGPKNENAEFDMSVNVQRCKFLGFHD